MASPALSIGSPSPDPFEKSKLETHGAQLHQLHQQQQQQQNHKSLEVPVSPRTDQKGWKGSNSPKQEPVSSPPTASNSSANLDKHELDAVIPENPAEEEESDSSSNDGRGATAISRQSSMARPSPLSQSGSKPRSRAPSSEMPSYTSSTAKMRKPSLLKKLSGLHIFNHHAHHENADYAASQNARHIGTPGHSR